MTRRYAVVLASALSITSCTSVYTNRAAEYHMINVDKDGKYTPSPPNVRFNPNAGQDDPGIYEEFLHRLFQEVETKAPVDEATGRKHVLIYVHGG